MARHWTCRGCKARNPRIRPKCPNCGRKRPAPRVPAHRKVLADMPYEEWVARFGERCGICGREPSVRRRLDRDHDHATGAARGLLCHLCNRRLGNGITPEWCQAAADYLLRAGLASTE